MYIFFYLSILLCIIGLITLFIGFKKQKKDLKILEKQKQEQINLQIKDKINELYALEADRKQLQLEISATARERNVEKERLNELKSQSRELLRTEKDRLQTELKLLKDLELQKLEQNYKEREAMLESGYESRAADIEMEISIYKKKLDEFKSMQDAVNDAIHRKKELEEKDFFYSINISESDQEDIAILQSMDAHLHNRDVIPKLIWELFIRRPTQEMIKRVTEGKDSGGIYKITYKNTGEAYIGKTTSFNTRWQAHVKTAIGLEGAARATIHNRMAHDGLWNYTFEILERVDKDHLSAREAFYIDFYGTKNQLNMKSGDKNGTQ